MADFTLPILSAEKTYARHIDIKGFCDNSEQRNLLSSGKILGFKLRSPNCTKADLQAYRAHFDGQTGELYSFGFVDPFDSANTQYTVRYVENSYSEKSVGGNLFYAEFAFKRVNA